MIQNVTNFLQDCNWSEIISILIGLLGLLFALISYFKSNRKQLPQYLMHTARLRSSMFENSSIEIRQSDRIIEELCVSMVAIWNKGITIKHEDVATKVPLQIVAPDDAEILEMQPLYADEANNIQYNRSDDKKKVHIDFEYLAKNDGIVLKIFHTCREGESLKVYCALNSGVKIAHARGMIMKMTSMLANKVSVRTATRFLGIMLIILCVIEILTLLLGVEINFLHMDNQLVKNIQLLLYIFLLFYVYRAFFYRRLPKKLAKAYNEE